MAQIYEKGAATGCPGATWCTAAWRAAYDLAASYRAQGFAATAECLVHYLVLAEERGHAAARAGAGKANPPTAPRPSARGSWPG